MKKCPLCKKGPLSKTTRPARIEVAGHVFTATLPALTCAACGETTIAGPDIERFEHAAARALAERGQRRAARPSASCARRSASRRTTSPRSEGSMAGLEMLRARLRAKPLPKRVALKLAS